MLHTRKDLQDSYCRCGPLVKFFHTSDKTLSVEKKSWKQVLLNHSHVLLKNICYFCWWRREKLESPHCGCLPPLARGIVDKNWRNMSQLWPWPLSSTVQSVHYWVLTDDLAYLQHRGVWQLTFDSWCTASRWPTPTSPFSHQSDRPSRRRPRRDGSHTPGPNTHIHTHTQTSEVRLPVTFMKSPSSSHIETASPTPRQSRVRPDGIRVRCTSLWHRSS